MVSVGGTEKKGANSSRSPLFLVIKVCYDVSFEGNRPYKYVIYNKNMSVHLGLLPIVIPKQPHYSIATSLLNK